VTSSALRSSIGIALPSVRLQSMVEKGSATKKVTIRVGEYRYRNRKEDKSNYP
jgi:hypothetical protein